jgi:hypothetical protein
MDGLDSFETSLFYYQVRRDFGYRDFMICEGKVYCPLVSRMSKRRLAATCPFDGRRRPSAKINIRDLFGLINSHDQIPAFLNLIHTSRHFRVSVIGISRLAKTRVLSLWFPGCQNTEALTSSHVYSIDGRSRYFHGPWGLRSRFLHLLQG